MPHGEAPQSEQEINLFHFAPDEKEVPGTADTQAGQNGAVVAMGDGVRDAEKADEPDEGEKREAFHDGRGEGTLFQQENEIDTRHL